MDQVTCILSLNIWRRLVSQQNNQARSKPTGYVFNLPAESVDKIASLWYPQGLVRLAFRVIFNLVKIWST